MPDFYSIQATNNSKSNPMDFIPRGATPQWNRGNPAYSQDPNSYYAAAPGYLQGFNGNTFGWQYGPAQRFAGSNTPMFTIDPNTPLNPSNMSMPAFPNQPDASYGVNYGATPGFQGGYDQQAAFRARYGQNFQLSPGQTAVQGQGVTQYGRPIGEDPTFTNVLNPIYNTPQINQNIQGGQAYGMGQSVLQKDYLNSPEIQQILRTIQSQGDINKAANVSAASALAGRRGISGSSIEQFGTQQAAQQADQATMNSQVQVLLQQAQQAAAARQAAAQGYFQQGNQQGQLGAQANLAQFQGQVANNQLAANLTSDELASLRNLQMSNNQLALQKYLGERGIQTQNQALADARDANARANSPLNSFLGGVSGGLGAGIGKGLFS